MGNIVEEAKSKLNSMKAKTNEKNKEREERIIDCQILREEMKVLQDNVKALKNYNIDWILEWSKTSNFAYWVNSYSKNIANRSVNAGPTENNMIVYENGDIYYGSLLNGLREGDYLLPISIKNRSHGFVQTFLIYFD